VIHLRGNDDRNLLVIEVKSRKRSDVPKCDQIKLEEFTRQDGDYHYEFGLFIGFDELRDPQLAWFSDGRAEAYESLSIVQVDAVVASEGLADAG
jgi:hypothetical protein